MLYIGLTSRVEKATFGDLKRPHRFVLDSVHKNVSYAPSRKIKFRPRCLIIFGLSAVD